MIHAIHLIGKYHSKRVVHVKMLDALDVEDNLTTAAKLVGKDATGFDVKKAEWRNGVKRFIVAVSEPTDVDSVDLKMRKVTVQDLDQSFGDLFTAKDQQVLEQTYRDFHEVSLDEIEAISGKARVVSEA